MDSEFFLYRLRFTEAFQDHNKWTEEDWERVKAHGTLLKRLGQAGRLLFTGRSQILEGDINSVYLSILRAKGMEDAKNMMAVDPLITSGMCTAELNPYHFTMMFPQSFPVGEAHSSSE